MLVMHRMHQTHRSYRDEPGAEREQARSAARDTGTDLSVLTDMEATTRALIAADNAYVDEAMAGVRWERRGLLQRLTRS